MDYGNLESSMASPDAIKGRLLVVDDDPEMGSLLTDFFSQQGYAVYSYTSAVAALKALSPEGELGPEKTEGDLDVVISDIKMPQMDGIEFTSQLRTFRPEIPIVLITAFGSIETAIAAMQGGAFHYVVKPFKLAEMSVQIERAFEHRKLQKDNSVLRQEVKRSFALGEVIGKSPAMKAVFDLVGRVSNATANILITGESGSGKEVVARAIHNSGPRAQKPFVAINCTAIPETLLESELFGHAKGSFTGAIYRKRGLFEEAHGGTLFLDEIGDMNGALQSKLLRVLQEKKIRAVGENTSRDVDVRIIAATHKDLKAGIREGVFREDLYYRLSVIPIIIPSLRQRKEDIPLLAEHFLKRFAATNQKDVRGFTKRAMTRLMEAKWEGNVRELENIIERAVVLSATPLIDEEDIPSVEPMTADQFFEGATQSFPTLQQLERRYIELILERTAGRKEKAAQILGINRRTLYRKEQDYGFSTSSEEDHAEEDSLDS